MQRQIKILAIDSKEIILKSIRKALNSDEKTEYIITTSGTSIEGLKLIRNDIYDLVLLDWSHHSKTNMKYRTNKVV